MGANSRSGAYSNKYGISISGSQSDLCGTNINLLCPRSLLKYLSNSSERQTSNREKKGIKSAKRKNNKPWYHPGASPGSLYSSEPPINGSFYKKNRSLPTRAMYLVINLTIADMFVGGFSPFSLFVTLLYLCDTEQFPHLTLELTLTTGFLDLHPVSSDLSYKHCSNFIGSDACNNSSLYSPFKASPH